MVSKSSSPSAGSPPPMASRWPGQGASEASNSIPLAGRPVLFISGEQSASTSGRVGSPSMDPAPMTTPSSESTFVRLNDLDIQGDEAGSSLGAALRSDLIFVSVILGKKKKRGARAVAGEKTGRGLRQFSMKVCEKVESKGRITYNEVADELVAEFADPGSSLASPDQQQYDEKNIQRRVYDTLNVLMAMDIISKDKK